MKESITGSLRAGVGLSPDLSVALLVALGLGACGGGEIPPDPETVRIVEVMEVEDLRPVGDALAPLEAALADSAPAVRAVAVRGIGRLEDPALLDLVRPLLFDASADVQAAAFNAVAQLAYGRADPEVRALLERWATEVDMSVGPPARGALARSLGRLVLAEGEDAIERARSVIGIVPDESPEAVEGALLGLYYLALQTRGTELDSPEVTAWVQSHTDHAQDRVRVVAAMVLGASGGTSLELLDRLLGDSNPAVRRAAVGMLGPGSGDRAVTAMSDVAYSVRVQALRVLPRVDRGLACERALQALADVSHHVQASAIQLLSTPCPNDGAVISVLEELASSITSVGPREWHAPAQALLALATLGEEAAGELVGDFATHESLFVRAHAARVAGLVRDMELALSLADDPHANVRTAAITALYSLMEHGADALLIRQLEKSDPQLLLTAAQLLEGSTQGANIPDAALNALDRLSEGNRDTHRDPRVELLRRVGEFGSISDMSRVEPYLQDYDATVAELAATILSGWSGSEIEAAPRPNQLLPFPTVAEFRELGSTRVVLEMDFGGEISILLAPYAAATNAARFARLAEAGHFDGLTFHRVISNFIIQGGSPGANEYFGDGPFTRDEIGLLSHWRGTVGLSTRGRDTGDSQIFINTVDNLRLDHNYTIFGVVESGMDVVDATREGDVIRRARVERR